MTAASVGQALLADNLVPVARMPVLEALDHMLMEHPATEHKTC